MFIDRVYVIFTQSRRVIAIETLPVCLFLCAHGSLCQTSQQYPEENVVPWYDPGGPGPQRDLSGVCTQPWKGQLSSGICLQLLHIVKPWAQSIVVIAATSILQAGKLMRPQAVE